MDLPFQRPWKKTFANPFFPIINQKLYKEIIAQSLLEKMRDTKALSFSSRHSFQNSNQKIYFRNRNKNNFKKTLSTVNLGLNLNKSISREYSKKTERFYHEKSDLNKMKMVFARTIKNDYIRKKILFSSSTPNLLN